MEVNSGTSRLAGSSARWMNATSLLDKLTDRRVLATLAAVLALYAALSTARMVTNTLAWYGATDLYSWWWSGHVIRQGGDPYQAYFDHTVIELPVRYLDGFVVHSLPISRGLPAVPTNSPPMLFLLHLLSYLSWDTAKVTWMLLNMAMVATTPDGHVLCLHDGDRPDWHYVLLRDARTDLVLFAAPLERPRFGTTRLRRLCRIIVVGAPRSLSSGLRSHARHSGNRTPARRRARASEMALEPTTAADSIRLIHCNHRGPEPTR